MQVVFLLFGAWFLAPARAEMPLSRHVIASVREDKLPPIILRFTDALDRAREGGKLPSRLRSRLSFPLTLRETSYEVEGTACVRHFKESRLKSRDEAWTGLKRLADAFHSDPIRDLGDGTYGIATEAACSHVWSIKMDAKAARVTEITIDALQN